MFTLIAWQEFARAPDLFVFLSLEEEEPVHYEELQSPSEDVYVEAFHPTVKSRTGMHLYKKCTDKTD